MSKEGAAPPPYLSMQLVQDIGTSFLQMDPADLNAASLLASPPISDEKMLPSEGVSSVSFVILVPQVQSALRGNLSILCPCMVNSLGPVFCLKHNKCFLCGNISKFGWLYYYCFCVSFFW